MDATADLKNSMVGGWRIAEDVVFDQLGGA
jgi:hypothetical protein